MTHPRPSQRLSSILQQYGLRTYKIHACRSLYKKRAAYRAFTDKGSFLLKPYKGRQSLLNRVYSQLAWLKKHGFDSMPQWHRAANGKHWITKNRRIYYVTEWMEGTPLGEDPQDYERLGEVLARLHLISRRRSSVRPSFSKAEIHRFRKRHRAFARHLRIIQKNRNESGSWFRERGDQCLSMAEEAWNTLKQHDVKRIIRKEKTSIIHGDVTSPNVIVHTDGVYLVDWERARRGSAYYEVAKTLNNVAAFSVPYMKALLNGYEKHYPLMPEERLIITSLCRLPREAWIVAEQIRSGIRTDMFNVLMETWSKRLEAIRWLDAWASRQPRSPVNDTPFIPEEEATGIDAERSH
ncbi:phosphotransferase [Cohnella suwonensis]|uniref:Phosphotransferase n=1 Tax=Cohnella suwonensis TaxID=696072 RepID=A0ABW0LUV1_9BACL